MKSVAIGGDVSKEMRFSPSAVILKTGFPERRNSQSGITIAHLMAGCSLAGFLFPSATSWPLDSSAFLFIRFSVIVGVLLVGRDSSFVSEFIVLRRTEFPLRLKARNYILKKSPPLYSIVRNYSPSFLFNFGNYKFSLIIKFALTSNVTLNYASICLHSDIIVNWYWLCGWSYWSGNYCSHTFPFNLVTSFGFGRWHVGIATRWTYQ